MTEPAEPKRPDEPPRGLDAALRAAILRIGSSLDVDTVLAQIVESARALTGARYGVIAAADPSGAPREFTLSGFAEYERRALLEWPDRHALFAHLRSLAGPLRVPDLAAHIHALGFSAFPVPAGAFQATPMRHGEAYVGGFFLGGREGGFTEADEETLVLFAQQAAAAIVNARAHRAERRARANLEVLVETCPVGVVVLDAASGAPLTFNREARRILAGLHIEGRSEAEVAQVMTCRRADGRETTLDELRNAEMLRAEELELSVPDGRSVRTLVNATPIPSAEGGVETVVVTVQDLAPLDEFARSRAAFLSMVSHELRAPLAAVKGSAATALGASRDPDRAELRQFLRIVEEQADRMDALIGDLVDVGRIGAGTLAVDTAPVAVAALAERARTTFLGGGGRHAIAVDLPADLPRVMAEARRVAQVLDNLFANAARHAPAGSPIRVSAAREGAHVAVSVTDEGEGVPPERLAGLFRGRAGTGPGEAAPGGAGLGLAICKGLVEAHGGRIRAESGGAGRGLRVTFTLPIAEAPAPAPTPPAPTPPAGEKTPVLVVDDDPNALRALRDALAAAGYAPAVTGDPEDIPGLVEAKRPRLALLDLALPGADGIALMQTLPALAGLPVIFVSAYGREETVARALEAGAADYVVKPFSPGELVARVRAALRRETARETAREPEPFRLGDLVIDYALRRVTVAGRPVRLTATEYELLCVLSLDAGGVSTYDALLRRVWGQPGGGDPQPVRSFVRKLRRKLGEHPKRPAFILNERGLGYRMPRPGDPPPGGAGDGPSGS